MQLEPDFDLLMFAAKSFPFFSLNTVSYNRNAPIKNLIDQQFHLNIVILHFLY